MYICGVAQRRNESGENFVNIGLKVTPAARDALNDIGIEWDRPLGYIARKLVMRGLEAYYQDRLLDGPPSPGLIALKVEPNSPKVPLITSSSGRKKK